MQSYIYSSVSANATIPCAHFTYLSSARSLIVFTLKAAFNFSASPSETPCNREIFEKRSHEISYLLERMARGAQ